MEDTKKVSKLLLFICFLFSLVAAGSLGLASYVLATGKLPFDKKAFLEKVPQAEKIMPEEKKEEATEKNTAKLPVIQGTSSEADLINFENHLKAKQAEYNKLIEDHEKKDELFKETIKKLEQEGEKLQALHKKNLADLDAEMKARQAELDSRSRVLDSRETDIKKKLLGNIKGLAETISVMGKNTAAALLKDLDLQASTLILSNMEKEKQGEVLSALMEGAPITGQQLKPKELEEYRKRANDLVNALKDLNLKEEEAKK